MGEVIAFYDPGADITCQHTAGNVGGRGVSVPTSRNAGGPAGISDTGDGLLIVTNPAAGAAIFGVTAHDVAAAGKVDILRAPKVVPMECSAACAIGDELMVATDGRVLPRTAGNSAIGRCLLATTTAGDFAAVELFSAPALHLS